MNIETPQKKFGIAREFQRFINRGSAVDLGVAFVMGAAFKTVIDALAGDGKTNQGILGGLIGAIFGGGSPNFNDRGVTLNGSFVPLGSLLTAGVNFLMVALVLFFVIKAYGRFRPDSAAESTNELLESIRDELRQQR
ncbi:MAG: MscL family protein [Ilumatobacteraceae bacterium]